MYQQPNPVKASLSLDKVVVQQDGTVTEKIDAMRNSKITHLRCEWI